MTQRIIVFYASLFFSSVSGRNDPLLSGGVNGQGVGRRLSDATSIIVPQPRISRTHALIPLNLLFRRFSLFRQISLVVMIQRSLQSS